MLDDSLGEFKSYLLGREEWRSVKWVEVPFFLDELVKSVSLNLFDFMLLDCILFSIFFFKSLLDRESHVKLRNFSILFLKKL